MKNRKGICQEAIAMKIRIKDFRLKKHLTQTGLATAVECSQNLISRMESGTADPKASILLRLADYFHVSVDYLLYRSEISAPPDVLQSVDLQTARIYSYYLKFQELTPENQEFVLLLMEKLKLSQLSEKEKSGNL